MEKPKCQYRRLAGRTDRQWVVQEPCGKVIGWCCTEESARLLAIAANLVDTVTDLLQLVEVERSSAESGIGPGTLEIYHGSYWHQKLEEGVGLR
jgi:hypothetical protein